MKTYLKKSLTFIPSFAWMAFIYFLSSRSTTVVPGTSIQRFLILKTFHLIEFSALFIFVFYALRQHLNSIVLSYIYALSDELHQTFVPGREGRFRDTLIDLLGIFIGVLILKIAQTFPPVKKIFS